MRKLHRLIPVIAMVLPGLFVQPTLGREGWFTMERAATGEMVATLDGVVVGFGPDGYVTEFQYGTGALAEFPEGGQTAPMGSDDQPRGRAVRVVSGGRLITEIEAGKEVRYLQLNDVLYCGSITSRRVLYYHPTTPQAVIHRLVTDGRWETTFTYKGPLVKTAPELTTRDLRTGEIVYRAFDLRLVRPGVMEVNEEYYQGVRIISTLTSERDSGVGFLIWIKRITAPIPQNYFAFDFVFYGWPFSSR